MISALYLTNVRCVLDVAGPAGGESLLEINYTGLQSEIDAQRLLASLSNYGQQVQNPQSDQALMIGSNHLGEPSKRDNVEKVQQCAAALSGHRKFGVGASPARNPSQEACINTIGLVTTISSNLLSSMKVLAPISPNRQVIQKVFSKFLK